MTTPTAEQLELLATARAELRAALVAEDIAAREHKHAKAAVKKAEGRLSEALNEALDGQRQPRIPFEAAADPEALGGEKSWRRLTLQVAGFTDGNHEECWGPTVCTKIIAAGVTTCGELVDRLVKGDLFGIAVSDLQQVYADLEQLTENDSTPPDFNAYLKEIAEEAAAPLPVTNIVHCGKCKATYDATGRDRCPSCGRDNPIPLPVSKPASELWLREVPGFPESAVDELDRIGVRTLAHLKARTDEQSVAHSDEDGRLYAAIRSTPGIDAQTARQAMDAVLGYFDQSHSAKSVAELEKPKKGKKAPKPKTKPAAKAKRKAVVK